MISGCTFDSVENSDCSLFYSSKLISSKVIIDDCIFTGNLAKGSHFINGKIINSEIPSLYINSCKFSANTKFIKVVYNSNNFFEKNQSSSSKVLAVVVDLISAAIFIAKKFKQTNNEFSHSQKSLKA